MTDDDNASTGPSEPTADQRARSEAWDRVGQYLESLGEFGSSMARRNLDLWQDVAADLRTAPYTAETMSTTTARLMKAAIDNVEDVWSAMSQPPGARSTATVLPTVMLVFGWVDRDTSLSVPESVWVPVPRGRKEPPEAAEISLTGDGADAVARHVTATLDGQSYVVRATGAAPGELTAGTYRGIVFLTSPALALADLVVVVSRQP